MAMQLQLKSEERAGHYDGKIWVCVLCVHVSNLDLYFSVHGSFRNLVTNLLTILLNVSISQGTNTVHEA